MKPKKFKFIIEGEYNFKEMKEHLKQYNETLKEHIEGGFLCSCIEIKKVKVK
jgi:hypothetical protein